MSGDWDAYLAAMKPGPERYEERLHDVDIRVDGTVADVGLPTRSFLMGMFVTVAWIIFKWSSIKADGGFQNVTWTQRMTGCPAQ